MSRKRSNMPGYLTRNGGKNSPEKLVIANSGTQQVAPLTALFHGATGALAIALMILHAVWATVVLVRGSEKSKAGFHKFSIVVWSIWLIPYFVGMLFGMTST